MPTRTQSPGRRATLAALALALAPAGAAAAPLGAALDHLAARQDPVSGGFAGALESAWAALAVAAVDEHPGAWRRGGASLADAVVALPPTGLGEVERMVVAAAAAGRDPRALGGRDLVAEVLAAQASDGALGDRTSLTAWGVLAMRAGGLPRGAVPVRRAAQALLAAQRPDGGWAATLAGGSGTATDTASALQALMAAGLRRQGVAAAAGRAWLLRAQGPDGGFGGGTRGPGDALTTGWVATAIRALGEAPDGPPWSARAGGPLARLAALQRPDGGVALRRPGGPASAWATAQAAIALAGAVLPVRPPAALLVRRRAPVLVAREPADGDQVGGALIVRYRDDGGGGGVDPTAVRIVAGGADLTRRARVTPFSLQLPAAALVPGPLMLELVLADRAGNSRAFRWRVMGPPAG